METARRSVHLLALLAAILLVVAPARGAQPVTTSLQVPLSGTVFVPLSDGSFDAVALAGRVHVVTQAPAWPSGPIRIHVNLDRVSGVGDISKRRYVATGANRLNLPFQPPDPIDLGFELRAVGTPPDPIHPPDPIMPLDVSFLLAFNPDTGALTAVSIESMSVPLP